MSDEEAPAPDVSISMSTHIGDYLRATSHLSVDEIGLHHRLQVAAWARGGHLDADHQRLARLAGVDGARWAELWPAVAPLWTVAGNTMHCPRMLEEIARARRAKLAAIARGKASGDARRRRRDEQQTNAKPFRFGVETPPPPPPPPPHPADPWDDPSTDRSTDLSDDPSVPGCHPYRSDPIRTGPSMTTAESALLTGAVHDRERRVRRGPR